MKKISTLRAAFLTLSFLCLFARVNAQVLEEENYSKRIMAGISNHGQNKNKPYITAGDRTYIIGTQDGNFPDMGRHVEGEMGGLWLHPIKLMDGFWAKITDVTTGRENWLLEAVEFINYPYGNRLKYAPILDGLETERFQFCPDGQQGMIIQYGIKNTGSNTKKLTFDFSVKTDLSPVWLSEEAGLKDHTDTVIWEAGNHVFAGNDSGNRWFTVWGTTNPSSAQSIGSNRLPAKTIGKGITATSAYSLSINKNSSVTLNFVIAGSAKDKNEAVHTYQYLLRNHASLLEKKKQHYASIIERGRIRIPDARLQEVYNWVKVNTEWLVRDVPGMGRGLGAGFMEYPWWFGCDNTYSLQAVMATGDFDLAKQTLRLLKNHSMKKNGNGRIVHEISTNGVVYNPGNTQETAHFIMCVEKLFRWTGDLEFIKEMYPVMKLGIQWLLSDMDQNRNHFPEGYGIMEVYGLNAELIDVAVYTQQALEATARIAELFNEPEIQKEYSQLASKLAVKINQNFWDEAEVSYCDFYGSKAQAIQAADGAITQVKRSTDNGLTERDKKMITYYEQLKRNFSQMPDISKGWITNKNWVITTPIEVGIAPKDRAIRLLDKIRKENVGEHGPYLAAVERTAMMTISTGVQAVSEYQYGRADESMWYVNKIAQTFSRVLPGSISEMMPDYGGFTQAWTSYGIIVPVVEHLFGIHPDAANKRIVFEPELPSGWQNISIEDLPVATNTISFSRLKSGKQIEYTLTSTQPEWKFLLKVKEPPGAQYYLNGKKVAVGPSGIEMSELNNKLLVVQ